MLWDQSLRFSFSYLTQVKENNEKILSENKEKRQLVHH